MYFSDLLLTVRNVTKYVKWTFKNHCSPLFALIDFRLKSFNHISYKRFPSILNFHHSLKTRVVGPLYSSKNEDTEAQEYSVSYLPSERRRPQMRGNRLAQCELPWLWHQ